MNKQKLRDSATSAIDELGLAEACIIEAARILRNGGMKSKAIDDLYVALQAAINEVRKAVN